MDAALKNGLVVPKGASSEAKDVLKKTSSEAKDDLKKTSSEAKDDLIEVRGGSTLDTKGVLVAPGPKAPISTERKQGEGGSSNEVRGSSRRDDPKDASHEKGITGVVDAVIRFECVNGYFDYSRYVLERISPVFRGMFSSGMTESTRGVIKCDYPVEDIKSFFETLEPVIFEQKNIPEVLNLTHLCIAFFYQIDILTKKYMLFLENAPKDIVAEAIIACGDVFDTMPSYPRLLAQALESNRDILKTVTDQTLFKVFEDVLETIPRRTGGTTVKHFPSVYGFLKLVAHNASTRTLNVKIFELCNELISKLSVYSCERKMTTTVGSEISSNIYLATKGIEKDIYAVLIKKLF